MREEDLAAALPGDARREALHRRVGIGRRGLREAPTSSPRVPAP